MKQLEKKRIYPKMCCFKQYLKRQKGYIQFLSLNMYVLEIRISILRPFAAFPLLSLAGRLNWLNPVLNFVTPPPLAAGDDSHTSPANQRSE